MLHYGCESWQQCLTAESISRLRNWHNKRIREIRRVTMCHSFVHQVSFPLVLVALNFLPVSFLIPAPRGPNQKSSASLQMRTGVFSIEHYFTSRTLLWAGYIARMPNCRLPKRLMLSWVREPRIEGGKEMTHGRSLERQLKYFGLVDGSGKRSPFRNGQHWRRTALAA